MVEHEMLTIDPYVNFYIARLSDLLRTRKAVNSPSFPMQYWNEIPIFHKGFDKGLRFGLDHAIVGSYKMLSSLGYEDAAKIIIEVSKNERED